jgi:hypothetical protein
MAGERTRLTDALVVGTYGWSSLSDVPTPEAGVA